MNGNLLDEFDCFVILNKDFALGNNKHDAVWSISASVLLFSIHTYISCLCAAAETIFSCPGQNNQP